ncbi:MAG: DUF3021 domain-containing protein [Oscillospiraceae bacterium]|nr:DUF3021 domain-containing protein [Oscillospiraceae bacterium]
MKYAKDFLHRGLLAAAGGPVILAVVYGILGASGTVTSLAPTEVCTGVLSITLMAFIAAGITTVYQIERLPLLSAILIHAGVLYLDYLIMYLLNGWIPEEAGGIGFFTVIFAGGYAAVWLCIWLGIRAKTRRLNRKLQEKQR